MCVYMCMCVWVCVRVCVCRCLCLYVCVCMCVCVRTCRVCVHVYTLKCPQLVPEGSASPTINIFPIDALTSPSSFPMILLPGPRSATCATPTPRR